jgi:hypothetical protein
MPGMTKLEAFTLSPEWYSIVALINQPEGNTGEYPAAQGVAQQFTGMWMYVLGGGKHNTSFHGLSTVTLDSLHRTLHYWEHSTELYYFNLKQGT